MTTGRKVLECLHITALAVWLGSLVMAGAVAAQVFPQMRDLGPRVPSFDRFEGDHWLIVAGHVGQFTFFTADAIQFACLGVALLTLIAGIGAFGIPLARWSTFLRALALGCAVLIIGYQVLLLGPEMNRHLREYWDAAQAGDNAAAEIRRQAFMDRHPASRSLLVASTLSALGALVAAVWSVASAGERKREFDGSATPSPYEPPALRGVR